LVAISGMEDIFVGETICPVDKPDALPILRIDPPTLQMNFITNNSPFVGREGDNVTARKLEDRLKLQLHTDVSLRVEDTESPDTWIVSGRGELHLSILIETLRREGFELAVSRPRVILREVEGKLSEPFENVTIDTPDEYSGSIIDALAQRMGEMTNMETGNNGQTRLTFSTPTRGLIGFDSQFLSMTRGYGIMNHTFAEYKPVIRNW